MKIHDLFAFRLDYTCDAFKKLLCGRTRPLILRLCDLALHVQWKLAEVPAVDTALSSNIFTNGIPPFALFHSFVPLPYHIIFRRIHRASSIILPIVKLVRHRNGKSLFHALLAWFPLEVKGVAPDVLLPLGPRGEFDSIACHFIPRIVSLTFLSILFF